MTADPIPADAVEAAARAYIESGLPNMPRRAGRHYHAMHAALTAAAPLIAAQATTELAENRDWWYESCTKAWQQRDAAIAASKQLESELADLRAGIEALRDEWRSGRCACLTCTETRRHADALDALLRGAK